MAPKNRVKIDPGPDLMGELFAEGDRLYAKLQALSPAPAADPLGQVRRLSVELAGAIAALPDAAAQAEALKLAQRILRRHRLETLE